MEAEGAILAAAITACRLARLPSRLLDAQIALAVFPALADLTVIEAGVWRQDDGAPARALRYSSSRFAASTLVPTGFWLEDRGFDTCVCGVSREWLGVHAIEALAICIAALHARLERGW